MISDIFNWQHETSDIISGGQLTIFLFPIAIVALCSSSLYKIETQNHNPIFSIKKTERWMNEKKKVGNYPRWGFWQVSDKSFQLFLHHAYPRQPFWWSHKLYRLAWHPRGHRRPWSSLIADPARQFSWREPRVGNSETLCNWLVKILPLSRDRQVLEPRPPCLIIGIACHAHWSGGQVGRPRKSRLGRTNLQLEIPWRMSHWLEIIESWLYFTIL